MSEVLNAESIASIINQRSDDDSTSSARAMKLALELHALGLGGPGTSINSGNEVEDLAVLGPPKKSQNTIEIINVPSSEHVAEIVGKQGCKIKILRQKTNTYIKTPGRGDDPQFVITGRAEDVQIAADEIREAAEHFTVIRAQRSRIGALQSPLAPNEGEPGTVTVKVRVPYKVVGLVVGPKGTTIKRIQQQTHTYIVTPSREKDPVFEVSGLPENVEVAKQEIEAHIATRTGSGFIDRDLDFAANGTDVGEDGELEDPMNEKNQSDRAMAALQTLAKLSSGERAKLQAALQSLNNNSYRSPKPQPVPVTISHSVPTLSPLLSGFSLPQSGSQSPLIHCPVSSPFDHIPSRPESASLQNVNLKTNLSMYRDHSLMNIQPVSVSDDIDDSEEPQIVVDLKQLGVDLDKDVGRSIQKEESSEDEKVDVAASKLNPSATAWTPTASKIIKTPKPISKPSGVNMAPNFSSQRKTPPNVQKIAAGDGIYIQTKHKQTTLRSSRDVQNFPSLQNQANQMTKGNQQISPIVAQALLARNQRSPSPADDLRSMGTMESGYQTETATTISDMSGSYNTKMCGICQTHPKSAAFVPCGHSSFCFTCALTVSAIPDARCPICSTPIKMALNIK